jgi:hypothetical protein
MIANIVTDQPAWNAYQVLLHDLWYPQAYEYLFGSVRLVPFDSEGTALVSALHARLRHWHKRATEALVRPQHSPPASPFESDSSEADAFVIAFDEISVKSEELLEERKRITVAPKKRVLYQDLEHIIWKEWQVRPDDITVNQVRHALYLLARKSVGSIELDQVSCEVYGIDYSKLMTLMSASVARVTDLSSEPKVPRVSATEPQPASARNEPDRSVPIEADGDIEFASDAERNGAVAAYCKAWNCSEASLGRTAIVDPADLSKWKKGSLPAASLKLKRIEEALKGNKPPTPIEKRPSEF